MEFGEGGSNLRNRLLPKIDHGRENKETRISKEPPQESAAKIAYLRKAARRPRQQAAAAPAFGLGRRHS